MSDKKQGMKCPKCGCELIMKRSRCTYGEKIYTCFACGYTVTKKLVHRDRVTTGLDPKSRKEVDKVLLRGDD